MRKRIKRGKSREAKKQLVEEKRRRKSDQRRYASQGDVEKIEAINPDKKFTRHAKKNSERVASEELRSLPPKDKMEQLAALGYFTPSQART